MKYKYVLTNGSVNIRPPKVNSMSEIKINKVVKPDRVELHEEFPNGLILDIYEYPDKIEYISNKKIIVDENLTLTFED